MKFFGSEKVAQNKRLIKELKEWGVLLVIGGIIYLGGWHTEVIGFAQRLLLSTHIIQPSLSPTPLKADKHSIETSRLDSMDSQDGLRADFDFLLSDSEGNAVSMRAFEGKTIFIQSFRSTLNHLRNLVHLNCIYLQKAVFEYQQFG